MDIRFKIVFVKCQTLSLQGSPKVGLSVAMTRMEEHYGWGGFAHKYA